MGDRGSVTLTPTKGEVEPDYPAPHGGALERDIIAAAQRLLGKWGISKTTVNDIAREANCSRATVYRMFPGGKQQLIATVGQKEMHSFFDRLGVLADEAATLEDALVAVIATSHRVLSVHRGLQNVLEQEPGLLLPYLGFHRIDRLYATVRDHLSPHFTRFVGDQAEWAVEWAARLALSYLFQPSDDLDLSDPAIVRSLVHTRVLPGFATPATA